MNQDAIAMLSPEEAYRFRTLLKIWFPTIDGGPSGETALNPYDATEDLCTLYSLLESREKQ